jgi:hypothetical protein
MYISHLYTGKCIAKTPVYRINIHVLLLAYSRISVIYIQQCAAIVHPQTLMCSNCADTNQTIVQVIDGAITKDVQNQTEASEGPLSG